ncbi:MAG: hypothetical protein CME64_15115 [Halobacteriovoraceae bacterium]|nr:hypothetical protein [Halobacteriovoraceae bacterium]|tara:strand:- start:65942 stop:66343 length:402 start_codon:yes stop_codon:yes gene_type:complete
MTLAISILSILVCATIAIKLSRKKDGPKELCLICEQELSDPHYQDGHAFCSTHLHVYKHGKWKLLHKGNATSEDPEHGVSIYKAKTLLSQLEMPCYIVVDYEFKDENFVTIMSLMVLEENFERAQTLSKSILN